MDNQEPIHDYTLCNDCPICRQDVEGVKWCELGFDLVVRNSSDPDVDDFIVSPDCRLSSIDWFEIGDNDVKHPAYFHPERIKLQKVDQFRWRIVG